MGKTIPIWQEPDVPPKLPPHVRAVRNPTGRVYYYLQIGRGTTQKRAPIRLPDDPREPAFWEAYAAALNLKAPPVHANAVSELDKAWEASPEWKTLSPKTKAEWTRYRARVVTAWGPLQVRGIEPSHVLTLRDTYADTPAAANNLLRCLSSMLGWSVPRGWRSDNPCREVRPLKAGEGYAPWPWDVIEAAKVNLRPDLWRAVAVALYTGQRKGDCLAMRWDAIRGDTIAVRQAKTGKSLAIPIHRDLRTVIETSPKTAVTILTSSDGTPWRGGFNASWRKSTWRPPDPLVFHGLRKSAVVTLLEAGCTDAEVSAITGQSRDMIEHYARQVSQERLARSAMRKWEGA